MKTQASSTEGNPVDSPAAGSSSLGALHSNDVHGPCSNLTNRNVTHEDDASKLCELDISSIEDRPQTKPKKEILIEDSSKRVLDRMTFPTVQNQSSPATVANEMTSTAPPFQLIDILPHISTAPNFSFRRNQRVEPPIEQLGFDRSMESESSEYTESSFN